MRKSYSVFPNPNSGTFTLEFSTNEPAQIKVQNILGEIIYSEQTPLSIRRGASGEEKKEINLKNSPAGIYFLQLQTNEKIYNRKIVIQ